MSFGTSSLTAAVKPCVKLLGITGGPAWFRNLVTLTLTGFAPSIPANLVLMAYRGEALVALAQAFTGPDTGATGTLDLNTSEMEAVFEGTPYGAVKEFDLFLYDSSVPDLLAFGTLDVSATRDYQGTAPLPPISSTTLFIGCFAFYAGATYIRSKDDGLYYLFQGAGSGRNVVEELGITGITIPGAPAL